jgi:hypothetical protein
MDGYRGKSVVYRVKRKHKNVLNSPFGLCQAYLRSIQTLREIEAWSTRHQPVHPC